MLDFSKKRDKTSRLLRNTQQISFYMYRSFGIIHDFWILNAMCMFMYLFVIFLICSCHLSKHPSICELFHIQVLMTVTETETLTSTLHHDIFTYLDYIFPCNLHTVGFYPYLLSHIYIYSFCSIPLTASFFMIVKWKRPSILIILRISGSR